MSSKSIRWLIRQVQRRCPSVSLRAGSGQALRLGSGQAYVEFVVVLPAVLLLLLLVWEFSYFWLEPDGRLQRDLRGRAAGGCRRAGGHRVCRL